MVVVGLVLCVGVCVMYVKYVVYVNWCLIFFFGSQSVLVVIDVYSVVFFGLFWGVFLVVLGVHVQRSQSCSADLVVACVCCVVVCLLLLVVGEFVVFYVGFELLLVFMFGYMGVLSKVGRGSYAQFMLVGYTLFGSGLLALALVVLYSLLGCSYSGGVLCSSGIGMWAHFVVLACGVGFFSKLPSFFFSAWLDVAHVEASTEGSIMLAGCYLKIGFLGVVRFVVAGNVSIVHFWAPLFLVVCITGLIACSVVLVIWVDIKRYIAGCSIVHMMLGLLGLGLSDAQIFYGTLLLVMLHSWCALMLFWVAGAAYEVGSSRCVMVLCSEGNLSLVWAVMLLVNAGFPCSIACYGELLLVCGMQRFASALVITAVFVVGIVAVSCLLFWVVLVSGRVLGNLHACTEGDYCDVFVGWGGVGVALSVVIVDVVLASLIGCLL
nr:NADH dehydrogenase subunit 4 [Namystynia karyoxenos]